LEDESWPGGAGGCSKAPPPSESASARTVLRSAGFVEIDEHDRTAAHLATARTKL
jgi:hypothetical protein